MTPDEVKKIAGSEIQAKILLLKDAAKPDNDLKKFMYDKNYEELKLSREWAIKVSVFTSAVYFGVITLANSETGKEIISGGNKITILGVLSIFACLGIWNICLRHLSYLEYRNIQIRLQNDLGVHHWGETSNKVFPDSWKKEIDFERNFFSRKNGLLKNKSGYLFYVFYLVTTSVVTAIVILNISKKSSAELSYLRHIQVQDSTIRSSLLKVLDSKEKISITLDTLTVRTMTNIEEFNQTKRKRTPRKKATK